MVQGAPHPDPLPVKNGERETTIRAIRAGAQLPYIRLAAVRREPGRQDLVDAAAVEVDDLEAPALQLEALADLWYAAEVLQHEAGDGVIAAMRRHLDRQHVGELVERHPAGDQQRAVIAADAGRLGRALL